MKNYKSIEEYKNEFTRNNYDRIGIVLPKGQKAELQRVAERQGLSLNGLIKAAIDEYIKNNCAPAVGDCKSDHEDICATDNDTCANKK